MNNFTAQLVALRGAALHLLPHKIGSTLKNLPSRTVGAGRGGRVKLVDGVAAFPSIGGDGERFPSNGR